MTEDWVNDLDEKHLIAVQKTFIPKDFRDKLADILYRLRKDDLDIYFYILLELQSTVDFSMPIRLLSYLNEIWRMVLENTPDHMVERKDFRLPAIVPMVLYNGERSWTAKRSFKEVQAGYEQFGDYLVNFKYVLFDVHRYDDMELLQCANVVSSVFYMDKRVVLVEVLSRLGILTKNVLSKFKADELRIFIRWMGHVLIPRLPIIIREKASSMLHRITPQEVEKVVANLGIAVEEALRDAEEKGIEKKANAMAMAALRKGYPIDDVVEITGLSREIVLRLKTEVREERMVTQSP